MASATPLRCQASGQRLKEEAPFAYKPITPVVQTVEEAGVGGGWRGCSR